MIPRSMSEYDDKKMQMRYCLQMICIQHVVSELDAVPYFPSYHGKRGDKNTILLYTKEDEAHNREVDKMDVHYSSKEEAALYHCYQEKYYYRPYFWSFQNDDANGMFTYDFANHGTLDLRGSEWRHVIRGSIRMAFYNKKQIDHVKSVRGFMNIMEADEMYNDYNRLIISAMFERYPSLYLGQFNEDSSGIFKPDYGDRILIPVTEGQELPNFCCSFAVPTEDEELIKMIRKWRNGQLPKSGADASKIQERVYEIGGECFTWF